MHLRGKNGHGAGLEAEPDPWQLVDVAQCGEDGRLDVCDLSTLCEPRDAWSITPGRRLTMVLSMENKSTDTMRDMYARAHCPTKSAYAWPSWVLGQTPP